MTKRPSKPLPVAATGGEMLIYETDDGRLRLEVRLQEDTLWMTQQMMAELFGTTVPNIHMHVRNILRERELAAEATIKEFLIVRTEGKREVTRKIEHYHLDMIIAVGYRVKSLIATRFRIWATQRLRDYIVKGFALDDERFKRSGDGHYFDELLARIRDIRSSEKVFWRKVLDIYATSIDYDPRAATTEHFFKTIQNKMHWAAHGHTAAEIVAERADATKPNMGLTSWAGSVPRKADVSVAKNYLQADELDALNRIVTMYLEFAELQAIRRKPMHMADWISKLDDFLKISDREVLPHAGKISHETATALAEAQYETHSKARAALPSPAERHFAEVMVEASRLSDVVKSKPARAAATPKTSRAGDVIGKRRR